MLYELTCSECNISFCSAANLLRHFAQHASQILPESKENKSESPGQDQVNVKKPGIPDLYPISSFKTALRLNRSSKDEMSKTACEDNEENIDSGVEDPVNPLRYCAVSMEDLDNPTSECSRDNSECTVSSNTSSPERCKARCTVRRYRCIYCSKTFGWSTDLKRHTLTHTGERPFKCSVCNSTFTRKFLLQKHQAKQHADAGYNFMHSTMLSSKIKIPPLRPIGLLLKHKSRKQDKQKIKRKVFNTKNLYQSVGDCFEVADNLMCSM